jgi:dipeptidyl aminopeptidase/acylaminoacyl peptidase
LRHGGPSGASIESFSSTNHMFAGNGFGVFQIDFRGSSNYGQEHLNANVDNWGIRDYDDIMTGVDWLVNEGLADEDRVAASISPSLILGSPPPLAPSPPLQEELLYAY